MNITSKRLPAGAKRVLGFPLIPFLTLKVPEKLQLYGLYVYYVVHICDFGMLRVKAGISIETTT